MASGGARCTSRSKVLLVLLALAAAPAAAQVDPRCPGPTLRSSAAPPAAAPWTDASRPPDERADLLLREMTLEEKVDLATGERCLIYGYFDAAIARLGIPALTMTDGPAGIRIPWERVNGGRATALPAPIAVAASWDPALADAQGDVLGAEAFATGHDVLLGPTLDVARWPLAGRTFEGLGEDPLLAARVAVPLVRAIQRHPVIAVAKHFAAYAQESDRWTLDARVDDRTLREIYLPPFAAAVRDGGAGAVMCGFNRVNGESACESKGLLRDVLDGELGFPGFVMSDWAAIHGTVAAATGGLDLEMAYAKYFGRPLADAVRGGAVPAAVVDEMARRILLPMFRVGVFDHPPVVAPLPAEEHGATSRRIAEGGVVLLKNDGALLPLDASVRSIAVIGPDAANASTQGGGAARVEPMRSVTPLDGLARRAGAGVRVTWAEGGDPVVPAHLLAGPPAVPSSVLAPPAGAAGARGLRAEYWLGRRSFDGAPDLVREERQLALSAGFFAYQSVNASSVPALPDRWSLSPFAARWTATLTAPATGDYALTLTSRGEGRVWLDERLVVDHSQRHALGARTGSVHLAAGEPHALRVEYVADGPEMGTQVDVGGDVVLGWTTPPDAVAPAVREAAAAAAAADVAVVVVRDYGTEERDRADLALPNGQDALVAAVAAANPRTVVVLMTGQPVSMPWLGAVRAVVEAWYPGQEQGDVLAGVLFGDVNPSGKLPLTFPRAIADAAPQGVGPGDDQGPRVTFAEGPLVGYRWYDAHGTEPLFPFGHGLSYTSFAYDGLEVRPASAAAPASVAFTLTNSGARAGAEVAQVYAGPCPGDDPAIPRRLVGFTKVALEPGASRRVTVDLAPEALATWSPSTRAWTPPACEPPLAVGSSSRDLRLVPGAAPGAPPQAAGGSAGGGAAAPGASAAGGRAGGGCGAGGGEAGALSGAGALAAALLARLRRRTQALTRRGARARAVAEGRREAGLAARGARPQLFGRGEDSMLDARFVEAGGALVVTLLTRSLDSEAAPELRRLVAERARGRALVVLSLEHVGDVDCSGLAAIVTVLRRMAPGGELRLAGARPQVRGLLAETGLDEVFPSFPDVEAALARAPDGAEAASP